MRLGIADVEAWLASISPAVIDGWIVYARVEPEQFTVPQAGKAESTSSKQWLDASEAAEHFGTKYL